MKNNAARQYCSRIQRSLVCSGTSRKRLLTQGKELVDRFVQENPDAQYADFVMAFGPPEAFAGEMLSTVDSKEVEDAQRRRRYTKGIVLVGLILVLIAACVLLFTKWSKVQEIIRGNYIIVTDDHGEIAKEEYLKNFEKKIIMSSKEGE